MIEMPDPKWIQKIYKDNTGEDYLGLRSVQANITEFLLPGIITTTSRARYYAFYSWLLYEYQDNHPTGTSLSKFIKRREQIFALANLVFDETQSYGEGRSGLIGTIKLRQHLSQVGKRKNIPLSVDDYINGYNGGYGIYGGVMRSLEITQYSEEGDSDLELLPKSKKLFDSFQQSIKGTEYFRDRHNYDTAKTIPHDVLLEYGEKCYLSALSKSPDGPETIEILFGFDAKTAFQNPQLNLPTFGNMGGTLGLILEMLDQSDQAFDDQTFRDCIMYGGCSGFTDYIPSKQFSDVLSHWRMFQLREYYVYALYEFWIFFLDILRTNGPFSFDKFRKYLDKSIDLSAAAKIFGLELPEKKLSQLSLDETLEAILSQSKIKSGNFEDRCKKYAKLYKVIANENSLQSLLYTNEELSQENLLGIFFFMLASIYLRLIGIQTDDPSNSWHWAREGISRRRSMALFVQQMNENRAENKTLLQIFEWLFRDYVLAQHTITAIEKWQQRSTNTFHFKYENGIYEWVEQDSNGFTGSRFNEAYSMIRDLGLVEKKKEEVPELTARGQIILRRVMEKLDA